MATIAAVLTPRNQNQKAQILEDYPLIYGWQDITKNTLDEQLEPTFNVHLVQICADPATIRAIEKDTRYMIVWSDDEEERPFCS